jgi:hypothetical protein
MVRAPLLCALCAALLLLAAGLALAGCAGELPNPGRTSSSATTSAGGTTTTAESPVAQLGKQVGATWSEAIQKLVPLLQGTPPIASIQQAVSALKEEYVQKMVALGRQITALSPDDQQAVYDRAADILSSTANTDWFKSYTSLYDAYAAGSDETSQNFAIVLSTFDTLTQYAFFNILKTANPDEAARLGIQ